MSGPGPAAEPAADHHHEPEQRGHAPQLWREQLPRPQLQLDAAAAQTQHREHLIVRQTSQWLHHMIIVTSTIIIIDWDCEDDARNIVRLQWIWMLNSERNFSRMKC